MKFPWSKYQFKCGDKVKTITSNKIGIIIAKDIAFTMNYDPTVYLVRYKNNKRWWHTKNELKLIDKATELESLFY